MSLSSRSRRSREARLLVPSPPLLYFLQLLLFPRSFTQLPTPLDATIANQPSSLPTAVSTSSTCLLSTYGPSILSPHPSPLRSQPARLTNPASYLANPPLSIPLAPSPSLNIYVKIVTIKATMSSAVHSNGDGGEVETINTNIVTLTRFLTEEQAKIKEATGDFTYVGPPPSRYSPKQPIR